MVPIPEVLYQLSNCSFDGFVYPGPLRRDSLPSVRLPSLRPEGIQQLVAVPLRQSATSPRSSTAFVLELNDKILGFSFGSSVYLLLDLFSFSLLTSNSVFIPVTFHWLFEEMQPFFLISCFCLSEYLQKIENTKNELPRDLTVLFASFCPPGFNKLA